MADINHEKLKSIYYHLKHYELFNGADSNPEWLISRIKDICDSESWTCLPDHMAAIKLHDKQIQFVREHSDYISKLYK